MTALRPGGCLAVVITVTDIPDQLGPVVAAARVAGLTYLQHIVVAHQLTAPGPEDRDQHQKTRSRGGVAGRGGPHLRVHTDLLIMRRVDGPRSPRD